MEKGGRRALHAGAWWAATTALWLLLAGPPSLEEAIAGVAAGAFAAAGAHAVWTADRARFRPRARWLLRAGRLPWRTVRDTAVLVRVLLAQLLGGRPARGALRGVPLDLSGKGARAAARRAIAVAAISFPPNTYVVFVNCRRRRVLLHELAPSAGGGGDLA
jgi:hypothetical protein